MPSADWGEAAAFAEGKLVVVGGVYDPAATRILFWSAQSHVSTLGADMPTPRSQLAAAAGPDGRVYAVGGIADECSCVSAALEAYQPKTDSWKRLPAMPQARYDFAAAFGSDGKLYVVGGRTDFGSLLSTVEVFDPASRTWSAGPSLSSPRAGLAAVRGPDGLIYAIGGEASGGTVGTVEALDTGTGTWTTQRPVPTPREEFGAAVGFGSLIYAVGGFNARIGALASVETYDTTTGRWSPGKSLDVPTEYLAVAGDPAAADADAGVGVYAAGGYALGVPTERVQTLIDELPPEVGVPRAVFVSGKVPQNRRAGLQLGLSSTASDGDGVCFQSYSLSTDGGPSTNVVSPFSFFAGHTYVLQTYAQDCFGNVSSPVVGLPFAVQLVDQTSPSVTYTGSWATVAEDTTFGGSVAVASGGGADATATFSFTGRALAITCTRGPVYGSATVSLDGTPVATANTAYSSTSTRHVLYRVDFPTSGPHTVVVDTIDSIALDGLFVIQ